MAEHDEGDLLVQSATGEADGEDGDGMFWGEQVVPVSYLHNTLSQTGWEGLLMVLVDAMFLHKIVFEAIDTSLVSSALDNLNKLAWGLFEDFSNDGLPGSSMVSFRSIRASGELEEVDRHVPRWLRFLLCATKADPLPDTSLTTRRLSQRVASYPFNDVHGARIDSLERLKMVWKSAQFITMFPRLVERLGPSRRRKLLCSMCVEVPEDLLRGRHRHYYDWSSPVKLARGYWNGHRLDSRGVMSGHIPPPEDLASVNPKVPGSWMVWLRSRSYRSTVTVYYTEVPHVFSACRADVHTRGSYDSQLHIVKCNGAILAASDDWQEYTAPFAQALSKHQWDLAWPSFVCKILVDLAFQILVNCLLSPVSHQSNEVGVVDWMKEQRMPLYAILLLGTYGAFLNCAELLSLLSMHPAENWVNITLVHLNAYRFFMVGLDTFTLFMMCRIGWDYVYPAKTPLAESIIVRFPSTVVFLVFFKWCQTLLQCMNISVFLGTLLPAWKALTEKESLDFLLALAALTCGTAMAYYALPVSNMSTGSWGGVHWEAIAESFLRLARLNFMGDIDHDEFEGFAPNTSVERLLNSHVHNPSSEHDDLKERPRYYWPLACFTLFCGVLFPVTALNLYVGVLSHAYDNAVNSMIHNEGVLQSTTSARYLLAFKFLPQCFSWSALCTERCTSAGQEHEQPGTWIGIASHRTKAPSGIEIDGLDLKDTIRLITLIKADVDEEKLELQEHRLNVEQRMDRLEKAVADLGDQADHGRGQVGQVQFSTTPGFTAGASSDMQAVMNRLERMEKTFSSMSEDFNKLKEALKLR